MNEDQALASLVEDSRSYLYGIIGDSYSLNHPREQINAFLELLPSEMHGVVEVPLDIPSPIIQFFVQQNVVSDKNRNISWRYPLWYHGYKKLKQQMDEEQAK